MKDVICTMCVFLGHGSELAVDIQRGLGSPRGSTLVDVRQQGSYWPHGAI